MEITGAWVFICLIIFLIVGQASAADVTIIPSTRAAVQEGLFELNVSINPHGIAIAGAQLNIAFSQSIKVNNITEGDIFKQNGANTFFNSGVINNSAGTVINIFDVIIGNTSIATTGTFIVISITSTGVSGVSRINLSNVKISSPVALPVTVELVGDCWMYDISGTVSGVS